LAIMATPLVQVDCGDPWSLNDIVNADGEFRCGCVALKLTYTPPGPTAIVMAFYVSTSSSGCTWFTFKLIDAKPKVCTN